MIANAKYTFALDELGRILFSPKQDIDSLQPVWTYDDGNSSILQADISMDHDLYGIPNVVEVVYSNGSDSYYARVVNDDPNSPISTVNRGREILHRVTNPDLIGNPTESEIKQCEKELKDGYNIVATNKLFVDFDSQSDDYVVYTKENAETRTKRLASVIDVFFVDFLSGKYPASFWYYVILSILVDIAAFIFFDIALKKNNNYSGIN